MSGTIFYRSRRKTGEGEKKPRYRIVAVADCNLRVYAEHLRLSELEHLAQALNAELVMLRSGDNQQGARTATPASPAT